MLIRRNSNKIRGRSCAISIFARRCRSGPVSTLVTVASAFSMLRSVFFHRVAAILPVIAILAIALIPPTRASAQVSGASLSGTITDPSGAAIADAKVIILNKATGQMREATAGSGGFYSVPNLLPGDYDVTVSAAGFSANKRSDLTLTVGAQQVLNVSLTVGEATQTVNVSAAAPMVQLGSSTLSGEVESATVRE